MTLRRSPLFVVGYARSGTTLLRSLLNAHSQIRLVNEPHLIKDMRVAGYDFTSTLDATERRTLVRGLRRYHLDSLLPGRVESLVDRPGDMTFQEVYEALLPRPDEPFVWGEKSPGNLNYMVELAGLYPDGLFIFVMRDPRATLLSYYRKQMAASDPHAIPGLLRWRYFVWQSIRWRTLISHSLASGHALGPDRFLIVRYEDLVRQPDAMLQALCGKLGVPYEPGMADPVRREGDEKWVKHSAGAHALLTQQVDATRADAGSALPRWAEGIITTHAADIMRAFDYPVPERKPAGAWISRLLEKHGSDQVAGELTTLKVVRRDTMLNDAERIWRKTIAGSLLCPANIA